MEDLDEQLSLNADEQAFLAAGGVLWTCRKRGHFWEAVRMEMDGDIAVPLLANQTNLARCMQALLALTPCRRRARLHHSCFSNQAAVCAMRGTQTYALVRFPV